MLPIKLAVSQAASMLEAIHLVADDPVAWNVYYDWMIDEGLWCGVGQCPLPSLTNSVGIRFSLIPAGTFLMGSPETEKDRYPDEGPRHEVKITKPFYLGVFPVTQGQWQTVMGDNPSWFCATGGGKGKVAGMDTSDFPVESISWEEANEFCKKLTALGGEHGRKYRLPSETEWEYACRGGASSYQVFHFGDTLSSTQVNFDGKYPYGEVAPGPYLERTSKVGSYPANSFGLYDMHGNVWEWCADWYHENYYAESPLNGPMEPGWSLCRVLRGGSFINHASFVRSAIRINYAPANRNNDVGFRPVAEWNGPDSQADRSDG